VVIPRSSCPSWTNVAVARSVGLPAPRASATGFFVANASNDAVLPAYVGLDGSVRALFTTVPHVRGSPLRLIEHGPDALLISVAEAPSAAQQILLTRLCVPPP
jgi:hypothetical protein